ncbi:conserved hypothetical protein [Xenorhabdus bovienii str. oregonense]|uniref:Transposase n=1 Tax=Xenorhabdus bovienii str. oregonense TaxID=1398202 RepID=A0A077NX57_XENBV|nr:conserved hypothetical protein [Xenorhabdus bovienii str. oregonense]
MAERGITVDHSTLSRWVPLIVKVSLRLGVGGEWTKPISKSKGNGVTFTGGVRRLTSC